MIDVVPGLFGVSGRSPGRRMLVRAVLTTMLVAAGWTDALFSRPIPRPPLSACAERTQVRLFFGLGRHHGHVSEAEWDAFLAEAIAPRFPDGLTVLLANGHWRGASRQLVREPSRVVEVIHGQGDDAMTLVEEVVALYKARFHQDSVMVTRGRLEVCF